MSLREKIESLPTAEDDDRWIKRADVLRIVAEHEAELRDIDRKVARLLAGIDGYQSAIGSIKPEHEEALKQWEIEHGLLDLGLTSNRLAVERQMNAQTRHPVGQAEGEPSKHPGELTRWRRELARRKAALAKARPAIDIGVSVADVMLDLPDLETLATLAEVIRGGKGEAVVPEGVAKHLRQDGGGHSPAGLYRYQADRGQWLAEARFERDGAAVYESTERLLAASDAYGNQLCEPQDPFAKVGVGDGQEG